MIGQVKFHDRLPIAKQPYLLFLNSHFIRMPYTNITPALSPMCNISKTTLLLGVKAARLSVTFDILCNIYI